MADLRYPCLFPHADDGTLPSLDTTLVDASQPFQSEDIQKQIERLQGYMTQADGRLNLHRSNLHRQMRRLDMDICESQVAFMHAPC